jgi:hypothetical protein
MADTRKPDYFFTADVGVVGESCQFVLPEQEATTGDDRRDLDFEESQSRWRPGDTLEW